MLTLNIGLCQLVCILVNVDFRPIMSFLERMHDFEFLAFVVPEFKRSQAPGSVFIFGDETTIHYLLVRSETVQGFKIGCRDLSKTSCHCLIES